MPVSERFQGANTINAGRRSPYWGEHAARYVFAAPHAAGKLILDIACGTGYGMAMLTDNARYVVGVDIDPQAVVEARDECGDRAGVLLGNGLGLPFADGTFELVTSFETLEHLHHRSEFLAELRRVMRPDAILQLSTPNANYSKPVDGVPSNPFHVHEYEPYELREEIEAYFEVVSFLGQTLDPATGIPPFYDAQRRLPNDIGTQLRLFGWKVLNKIPFDARERLSDLIWQKPFYPTEMDYNFSEQTVETAPTLLTVCRKA